MAEALKIVDQYGHPMEAAHCRPADSDDYWYTEPNTGWMQPRTISVSPLGALSISTVMACVRVLAESIASLSLDLVKIISEDERELARVNSLFDILHSQPNNWQTSFEYFEMMMLVLCLRGNSYNEIARSRRGQITSLNPLLPERMKVEWIKNSSGKNTRRKRYTYNEENGTQRVIPQDKIHHVMFMSANGGLTGLSLIQAGSLSMGLSKSAENYANGVFEKGGAQRMVLSTPGTIKKGGREALRNSWERAYGGSGNNHRVAVLEEGITAVNIGMTADDAQLIDTRRFQSVEIARIFRVPLHMIQEIENTTALGRGIEQISISFVVHTIRPWLRRIEQAMSRDLILEPDIKAIFNVDSMLRGDAKSRAEVNKLKWETGQINQNEMRRLDNLNGIGPDGDKYWVPMNFRPIDEPPEPKAAAPAPAPPDNSANQQALAVMIDDVAERLAARECSGLARAINSDNQKDAIEAFYERHTEYAIKAITPIQRASRGMCDESIDYINIAMDLFSLAKMKLSDLPAALQIMKITRKSEIETAFLEVTKWN